VLVLRYLCDLTDDDVAATLGTSTARSAARPPRLATLRRRTPVAEHSPTTKSTKNWF